jgi:peroxiredoxin
MQTLKPWFITLYIVLMVIIVNRSVTGLFSGAALLQWTGTLLTALPLLLLITRAMMLRDLPRTSKSLPWALTLATLGLLLASLPVSGSITQAALWAGVGFAGLLIYLFWYSNLDRNPNPVLASGQQLPDFSLTRLDGSLLKSSSLAGAPALLLFHRGNWCPFCVAQVKELVAGYRELEKLGVKILVVSPQPVEHNRQLARRFDAPVDFLTDPGNQAAKALGIAAPSGIPAGMQLLGYDSATVLPTVIITNADGTIVFTDQTDNYRVRPEPGTFLKALAAQAPIKGCSTDD